MLTPSKQIYPPIDFFYRHFHNSIRDELHILAGWVLSLDVCVDSEVSAKLTDLKARYKFLEQVYKYHSHVEDEVGTPRYLRIPVHAPLAPRLCVDCVWQCWVFLQCSCN